MKRPEVKDEKYIPPGVYCYHIASKNPDATLSILTCPYWEIKNKRPSQENGYCYFIEKGDWQDDGTMLLWDKCKECGKKYITSETGHNWLDDTKRSRKKCYREIKEWLDSIGPLLEGKEEKENARKLLEKVSSC